MAGSNPSPIIPTIAKSIRAALNNASANKGVGGANGTSTTTAVFINMSAFLRQRQASLSDVQASLAAQGWGSYFAARGVALAVSALKNVQQSKGDDTQLVTLRGKTLQQWLHGFNVPPALLAPWNAAMTTLFNTIYDQAVIMAKGVLSSQSTDVANVAAAQLLVAQGEV